MYEEGAPHVAQGVWDIIKERNVPLLGICYGMQVSNCDVCSFIQKYMYLT